MKPSWWTLPNLDTKKNDLNPHHKGREKKKRPKVVHHNPKNIVNDKQTCTLDSVTPVEEPMDFYHLKRMTVLK